MTSLGPANTKRWQHQVSACPLRFKHGGHAVINPVFYGPQFMYAEMQHLCKGGVVNAGDLAGLIGGRISEARARLIRLVPSFD